MPWKLLVSLCHSLLALVKLGVHKTIVTLLHSKFTLLYNMHIMYNVRNIMSLWYIKSVMIYTKVFLTSSFSIRSYRIHRISGLGNHTLVLNISRAIRYFYYHSNVILATFKRRFNMAECDCFLECHLTKYEAQVSSSAYPADHMVSRLIKKFNKTEEFIR